MLHNVSVSGAPFAVMEKMSRASIFLPQHLFNLGPSQRRNEDEMKMGLGSWQGFLLFGQRSHDFFCLLMIILILIVNCIQSIYDFAGVSDGCDIGHFD